MLKNILLSLFGKAYFKWEGRQTIKEQRYFTLLDIQVGEDSIEELTEAIAKVEGQLADETFNSTPKKALRAQADGLTEQLKQVTNKLVEHKQKLLNLDYKIELFNRL